MDRLYEQNLASAGFCVMIKEIYLGDIMVNKKQPRKNKKVLDKLGLNDQTNYRKSFATLDKPMQTYELSLLGKKYAKRKQIKKKGAL